MPNGNNSVSLSKRVFSDEDMDKLRTICDEHKFGYALFCGIVISDVLSNEELTAKYIAQTQQFEDDQAPATMAEMKMLKVQLRQYEEELEQLRAFKETALNDVAEYRNNNAYSR